MVIKRFVVEKYSDAVYVDGVFKRNPKMEHALYKHCKRYFDDNYRGVFFIGNEYKDEIFQNAFIKLWENIINKKIYVKDGEVRGKSGEPLSGKLTTYFMGIAKLKYLEWSREYLHDERPKQMLNPEIEYFKDFLYDDESQIMIDIISDCISHMSKRCNQILTLFYYEEKSLEDIIIELPSFQSKNALKTAKYKCMETLRKSANDIYGKYLNTDLI